MQLWGLRSPTVMEWWLHGAGATVRRYPTSKGQRSPNKMVDAGAVAVWCWRGGRWHWRGGCAVLERWLVALERWLCGAGEVAGGTGEVAVWCWSSGYVALE